MVEKIMLAGGDDQWVNLVESRGRNGARVSGCPKPPVAPLGE